MSKTKRSFRSDTKADDDEDVSSDHSKSEDPAAGHKKRHHKKSKKVRKHKSKRKESSDSDSDSSNSSDDSSDAEIVKRKKQKKQKKSKRRHRHETKGSSAADDSDAHTKTAKDAQKTQYAVDDDDERQRQKKNKRIEEMKKLRGADSAFDEKGVKSKWDSPTGDDFDAKRFRGDRKSNDGDGPRRDRSRRSPELRRSPEMRRVEDVPPRRVEGRRDDAAPNRFNRRPASRSRSRSVDLKRPRNPDFGRERADRERDVRPERAISPHRDRGFDRGRFNDSRPAAGRGRRSPSPRNDFDSRRDGGGRREFVRRPNFNDNRRGGDFDSANGRRGDNYRRPFERNDDSQRSNFRDRAWRDHSDREPPRRNSRDREPPRRNSRERGDRDRERRSSPPPPPPRQDNPFRRTVDSKDSGLDKHSNKIRHDERQDFRHGESRADRNDRHSPKRSFPKRERGSDNENYEWGGLKAENKETDVVSAEKEKPNFGLSGKLTEDTNKVNGVVIKYAEPPEARRSKRLWRFYPFKGSDALKTIYLHRQSCFLIGRDKKICEMTVDHPSCSKQHAALQYRLVPYEREDGTKGKHVLPYIIDLGSSNGTFVNDQQIEKSKYVELRERDVVKFGFSTREYVLLHGDSKMAPDENDPGVEDNASVKSEPSD